VEPAPVRSGDTGLGVGYSGELIALVQELLKSYGYGIDVSSDLDFATEATVRAFQRHFRPSRVDGRIDQSTITTLERLLTARDKLRAIA
jgi:N-acetylmuramoyl-L-alanine amidase